MNKDKENFSLDKFTNVRRRISIEVLDSAVEVALGKAETLLRKKRPKWNLITLDKFVAIVVPVAIEEMLETIDDHSWFLNEGYEQIYEFIEMSYADIISKRYYKVMFETGDLQENIKILIKKFLNESDPKVGTGKKPKGSGRRLYTDENPSDTVSVKFRTKEDIVDTLNKDSFKSKPHKRQSQIINLIHQRVRAAYQNAKDPETKKRLKRAFDYILTVKEKSKEKTIRLQKQEQNEGELTEKCWPGYTQKGMKKMFGKRYPNCVKKIKK